MIEGKPAKEPYLFFYTGGAKIVSFTAKTAESAGDDAAARFTEAIENTAPGTLVVPVWTTECEEHDGGTQSGVCALCAGVGCYHGICWKAYQKQLGPLAKHSAKIGALLLYKEFGQDTATFPETAGWVSHALGGFQSMPPKNGGEAIAPERLFAVLQGWNVSTEETAAQRK